MDAVLRPAWKDLCENMALMPKGFVPAEYYDLVTVGCEDAELFRRLRTAAEKEPVDADTRIHVLSRQAVAAANLGLAEHVRRMIPGQVRTIPEEGCDTWGAGGSGTGVMPNRPGMREGPGCLECQRLGNAANALHAALLQTAPPAPGKDSIIRVFPAWPQEWDAQFTLAARGAFLIGSLIRKGRIELVQVTSQAGSTCRLVNPWPGRPVNLYRNGTRAETLSGELLTFATKKGETIVATPEV